MATDNKRDIPAYLLKENGLYEINYLGGYAKPSSVEQILDGGSRYNLILDDAFFYYIYIGKLNVPRKKLRQVIKNFIQPLMPMELFGGFGICCIKNNYTAVLYTFDFIKILEQYEEIFKKALSITTVFCELSFKYPEFYFTDGEKIYEKTPDGLLLSPIKDVNAISAEDFWDETDKINAYIEFEGISRSSSGLRSYSKRFAFLLICYALFVTGLLFEYGQDKRVLKIIEKHLENMYENAGVSNTADPYGMLLSKARGTTTAPYRAGIILGGIEEAALDGLVLDSLSISERSVKMEGYVAGFSKIDEFKSGIEKKFNKKVSVEDSRQIADQVKFILRLDQ